MKRGIIALVDTGIIAWPVKLFQSDAVHQFPLALKVSLTEAIDEKCTLPMISLSFADVYKSRRRTVPAHESS